MARRLMQRDCIPPPPTTAKTFFDAANCCCQRKVVATGPLRVTESCSERCPERKAHKLRSLWVAADAASCHQSTFTGVTVRSRAHSGRALRRQAAPRAVPAKAYKAALSQLPLPLSSVGPPSRPVSSRASLLPSPPLCPLFLAAAPFLAPCPSPLALALPLTSRPFPARLAGDAPIGASG